MQPNMLYKDGKFDVVAWSGLTQDLYDRWKNATDNGTRPVPNALQTEILEFVLKRDRAISPNLSAQACPYLTDEKRAELLAKYPQAIT